ncbi:MAG: AI-2E family transporter [Alphaproteobacteria bacterium]
MIRRAFRPLVYDLVQRQGLISGALLLLAVVYTLYFAKALLMPVCLAVLAAMVLRPVVRALGRIYIPEIVGAAIVILTLLAVGGWLILALSGPAGEWIERAPLFKIQLEYKLEALRGPLEKVQEVTKNLQEAANLGRDSQPSVTVEGPSLLQRIFVEAQNTLISIMVMLALVFFLLARGGWTLRRVTAAIEDEDQQALWTDILSRIQSHLAKYLLTVGTINTVLGIATAITMYLLSMPNPLLWGVLAGVLNFIPYAGALATLTIIGLVSILTFDQWLTIMLPPLAFMLLTALEGQFFSPFIVGRQLTLDPIAVFMSVLFWGWLWGFPGMLLAVPILAAIKIAFNAIGTDGPISAIIDSEGDEEIREEMEEERLKRELEKDMTEEREAV